METPAYLLALRARYPLHPVFAHITPTEAVLIEHPHVAETDETRLAYTRNAKDGEAFLINGRMRQTITSVTKYVRRHYPEMKDHEIFALSKQNDEYLFLTDVKEIIHAVETGPSSCMKSSSSVCRHQWKMEEQYPVMLAWLRDPANEEPDWELHPYYVYSYPGWSLAIHKGASPVDGSHQIVGRALVYKNVFVRSFYQNKDPSGYSLADTALEAWLQEQGVKKQSCWDDGTKIALIQTGGCPLLPYIDGGSRNISVFSGHCEIVKDGGEYKAENTDGTGDVVEDEDEDESEAIGTCSDCGEIIYDGDDFSRVRDDCSCICTDCLYEYTYVRAYVNRRVTQWYVPDEEVVYVDGASWDRENLHPDFVQLEDGDYTNIYNAVEIDNEYYLPEDGRVVEIEGEYYLKSECWQDVDGAYHTPDEECALVNGCCYTTDDDRIVETAEGVYRLAEAPWEDVDGIFHHESVPSYEYEGKRYTAAQLEELHKDQVELEFV
jgi:hypothetical protein